MLMSLIMTFMFEPAKLQMNCANASGTSIALTEGVGALDVVASVIGIDCALRCPRGRAASHDTTAATGPAGLESGPRSRSLRVTRPDCLDQEPLGMAHERTLCADLLVQFAQARSVLLGAETWNGPDDHPEEIDDRSDVEDLHAERLCAQILDPKAGRGRLCNGPFGPPGIADVGGTEEELGELVVRARSHVLGQVRPARSQHPCDLRPTPSIRMTAQHEVECSVVVGEAAAVGCLRDHDAEALEASGRLRHVRRPRLRDGEPFRRGSGAREDLFEDLAPTGLDVEDGPSSSPDAFGGQAAVRPFGALLGGAPFEP